MKRLHRGFSLVAVWTMLLTASLAGPLAFGQTTATGALLQGTVQDRSGALIPGATVTITNDATGVSEKATTDQGGRYVFNDLEPASYTMAVEMRGFKILVRPNVVLRVSQQTALDFTLEVGSVSTTVEVKGSAPLLNSASATLGQVVDTKFIADMPLRATGGVLNLAFLVPGVTEIGDSLFGGGNITGVNYATNGQRNSSADVKLDGAIVAPPEAGQGSGQNSASYTPIPDAVEQFNIQNNSLSAEYGSSGGTVVQLVTKSGTNQYHGSGFWFANRPWMNANSFFGNKAGLPKPSNFKSDEYGGTIGGPIIRQKTFFFFDYDRSVSTSVAPISTSVPTMAQRAGDFSNSFNPDGTPINIYNPFSVHPVTDANGNIVDYQRDPFPNNVIPSLMIDPVAAKAINFYPLPTTSGSFNNFTKNEASFSRGYQFDVRIDHSFSEKSRLSGRWSHAANSGGTSNNVYANAAYPNNAADPDMNTAVNHINDAVLEETYSINPTTVLVGRFAVDRSLNLRAGPNFDPTSIGWPSYLLDGGFPRFPGVNPANYGALGNSTTCVDTISARTEPNYSALLNKIKGAHNLKIGGEQRMPFTNFGQPCDPAGTFFLSNDRTSQSVFNPAAGAFGNSIASFLLGWSDFQGLNIQPGTATKSKETAFFIQDDWRKSSRLTVNLGLRYEWSDPYTERFNHIQFTNLSEDSGMSVPGLGEIHGVSDFATPRQRTANPDLNNFAPRLGLAYRLSQKTVLRVGAGVYYNNSPATNNWLSGPAFRGATSVGGSLDGGVTRNGSVANPFPAGVAFPQGTKYGKLNMWGLGNDTQMGGVNEFRNGEIYQWNGGVQHELKGNMLVEVVYTGSRSHHLQLGYANNYNFVSVADRLKYGSLGLSQQVANPFYPLFQGPNAILNAPTSVYNSPTTQQINLLRPYPQFPGVFFDWGAAGPPRGNGQYDGLQLRLEKRYSSGLYFLGSLTFSRMYDDGPGSNTWLGGFVSPQDPTNIRGWWSRSAADVPRRMVWSWGYELPVGRGKHFGSNANRWVNGVVGGWNLNGIWAWQSGLPIHVGLANARLADGSQLPNIAGNPRSNFSIQQVVDGTGSFFNASAFSAPPDQVPGNAPRYNPSLRGDGIHNLDATIFKNFEVRESMALQFRAEFANFTNTPRFANPDSGFGDPTFGQIFSQYNSPRTLTLALKLLF